MYADPGVGKTRFAATAAQHPEMSPVLFLNIDGGLLSIADMDMETPPMAIDVRSVAHFEEVFWKLHKRADEGEPWASIKTVVIDNATELVVMALEEEVGHAISRETSSGKASKHASRDDIWLGDRGTVSTRMTRLLRWYRNLDLHCVFTAHVRRKYPKKKDGTMGTTIMDVNSEFPQGLQRAASGYMDTVWYMYIDEATGERRCITSRVGVYYAKTRGENFQKAIGQVFRVPMDTPALAHIYHALTKRVPLPEAFQLSTAAPNNQPTNEVTDNE